MGTIKRKKGTEWELVEVAVEGGIGADGESAYEVAVANGFIGTEVEWLASLKGSKGDQGIQGLKGDTGDQGIQGLKGDQGIQGIQGDQGIQGLKGDTGVDGDSAYQVAVSNGFVGTEVEWIESLNGADGIADTSNLATKTQLANVTNEVNYSLKSGKNTLPKLISFISDGARLGELDLGQVFINNSVPLNGSLITDKISSNHVQHMTWDQIRNFVNNNGFEYGSIKKSNNIDSLTIGSLTDSQLDSELKLSKEKIEMELGKPCNFLTYPNGTHDLRVRSATRKYYKTSFSTDTNGVNTPPISMHPLWRLNSASMNIATLQGHVDTLNTSTNGWLIFLITPTTDRIGDYSKYDTLLKYIATLGIKVVTVSEGLKSYENKIDVGDFIKISRGSGVWEREKNTTPHFMADALGNAYGNNLEMGTRMNFYGADISINKPPTDYEPNTITYEKVSGGLAISDGFPKKTTGMLVTHRFSQIGHSYQVYYVIQGFPVAGGVYTRSTSGVGTIWYPSFSNPHNSIITSGRVGMSGDNLSIGEQVFDTTLGKPLWVKTLGVKEVDTLTITAIPTTLGDVTVTLNGVAKTVSINPATDTTTDLVATKIRGTAFTGWTTGGTGSAITFTKTTTGTNTTPTFADTGATGATATFAVTTLGKDNIWVDATGATV